MNALYLIAMLFALALALACAQERIVAMRYSQPLTNCYLLATTNAAAVTNMQSPDWHYKDYTLLSNGDWHVDASNANEFYRVGGDPVP